MVAANTGDNLTTDQREMARGWFGYGHWAAPYWFIGLEPGGDELDECVRLWIRLGKGELLDIVAHHAEHTKDWFSAGAGTQPTWAKLIWLLLAFKDEEPTKQATLAYQKDNLGRIDGETAVLEISCLPAKHNGVPVSRELFRTERIATFRERLLEFKPRFVVFYSPDMKYRKAWNAIAGCELVRDEPTVLNGTAFLMTYHTNGEWSKAYWREMGQKLRALAR